MIENILLLLSIATSFAYMILALAVMSHRNQEKNKFSKRGWEMSPLWAFFPEDYNNSARSLCVKGRALFWCATVFSITWMLLK